MQGAGFSFFFFNDTATTEIYTLSLHDALPICRACATRPTTTASSSSPFWPQSPSRAPTPRQGCRSEEHTSELQSHLNLVCRLLLEKKKNDDKIKVYKSKKTIQLGNHQ